MRYLSRSIAFMTIASATFLFQPGVRADDAAAPAASTAAPADGGPTDDQINQAVTKQFATSDVGANNKPYYTYKVIWKSIKRGASRDGDYWTDGTPANTKTTVFPIKAEYTIWRKSNVGGYAAQSSDVVGEYVLFKNEFGDWTLKAHKHDATPMTDVK